MTTAYEQNLRRARAQPSAYWLERASMIEWERAPTAALGEAGTGPADWFPDGRLNMCHNALDRHVARGRGALTALVAISAMTGNEARFSFAELALRTAKVAGMIQACGVQAGDRVIIYMPMVAEAAIAMLACARIGAVHAVVFGGFAARELAKRIVDAQPRLILTASGGIEPGRTVPYLPILDEAMAIANASALSRIVLRRAEIPCELGEHDQDWTVAEAAAPAVPCVPMPATAPLYILYTSGTTGIAKGVVHDTGGYAVALMTSMADVYGVATGDCFWAASDIGWAVGHSFTVYGPLIAGCTTILYEGKPVGTPDAGVFWRIVRDHNVNVLFTAPTALRAIRRDDPYGEFIAATPMPSLRALFLAGERTDPDTLLWARAQLQRPVIDHWWQTELGWPALAVCYGLSEDKVVAGSAGKPVPGYDFVVMGPHGEPLAPGDVGELAIRLPLPPGCLIGLWDAEQKCTESYFARYPGHYATGDAGWRDDEGYFHIASRVDDLINVAGHRLSTGGIEQILLSHPAVTECAVIGAADSVKGMVPVALAVLGKGHDKKGIAAALVARVRAELGPVAAFRSVAFVPALPKTRSGKIVRGAIRAIADGQDIEIPASVEDPDTLGLAREALRSMGYANARVACAGKGSIVP